MQADYDARFTREMGCTADELRQWLPGASRQAEVQWLSDGAVVRLADGLLSLRWQPLPPRRIALITLPRLSVQFDFGAISAESRKAFMRHFDLYTQRGGG